MSRKRSSERVALTEQATSAIEGPPSLLRGQVQTIRIDQIDVGRGRLRRDLGDIGTLAESIYTSGLNHPITVSASDNGHFRLIAGERRLRAAISLAATHIDAVVRVLGPGDDALVLELVENLARRELSDEEEADGFITLVREKHFEVGEVAQQVGRSPAYVSKRIRVFEDARLRRAVASGQLSVSEAEEFVIVTDIEQRHRLLDQAVEHHWDRTRLRAAVHALGQSFEAERSTHVPLSVSASEPGSAAEVETLESGPASNDHVGPGARTFGAPGNRAEDAVPPGLQERIERPSNLAARIARLTKILADASLYRRLRELDSVLDQLRPWQLTAADDEALRELYLVLHGEGVHEAATSLIQTLGRHARTSRERRLIIPSIEHAEAAARRSRSNTRA